MSEEKPASEQRLRLNATTPTASDGDFVQTKSEINDLEEQQKQAEVDSILADLAARKIYVGRVFWLIVGWLVFVGTVIVMDGRTDPALDVTFDLSDAVLIALITTTTVNIIGLFFVILRYLFPAPK